MTNQLEPADAPMPWNSKAEEPVGVAPLDPSAQAAFETAMKRTRRLTEVERSNPFSDDLG